MQIHQTFADMHFKVRGQKSESFDGLLQKTPEDSDWPKLPSEMDEKGKNSQHPCILQPLEGLPNLKPSQDKSSSHLESLGFGSPINPPSPSLQTNESSDVK